MNKKAQLRDIIFVMVSVVSIALTMVIAAYMYEKIGIGLGESGLNTTESTAAYTQMGTAFPIFNNAFAFIIIGLSAALLVSSFFIPSHPIMLVINIVGLIILVVLGAIFANMYHEVMTTSDLNVTANTTFGTTSYIVDKLPMIAVIIVFLSTIIMYSKGKSDGTYG